MPRHRALFATPALSTSPRDAPARSAHAPRIRAPVVVIETYIAVAVVALRPATGDTPGPLRRSHVPLFTGPWRRRRDDRVRRATASLRGAALAVAAAAAALGEQLVTTKDCPDDDLDCLSGTYAQLMDQRQRIARAATEVDRLERTALEYDGRVPSDAPRLGGQVPTVVAARAMVDRTHDRLLEALQVAREALATVDPAAVAEGAAR